MTVGDLRQMINKRPKAIEEPPKEPPKAIELPPPPKEPELQAVSPGNGKTDRNSDGHSLLYIKLNFPLLDCLSVRLTLKKPIHICKYYNGHHLVFLKMY